MLLTFLTEHSRRLHKRAPCFFNMCIPGLTEQYKMSVFFHTSSRTPKSFGIKLVIVTEEASSKLIDKFEQAAQDMFNSLKLEMTIDKIQKLEAQMFLKQSKYFPSTTFY